MKTDSTNQWIRITEADRSIGWPEVLILCDQEKEPQSCCCSSSCNNGLQETEQNKSMAAPLSKESDIVEVTRAPPLSLTLLHSEQPKLYRVLAVLSAKGLRKGPSLERLLPP